MHTIQKIYFASGNTHKRDEMQRLILEGIHIVLPKDEGIAFDPVEDGESFIENALIKARCLYDIVHAPVLADDSGLVVDAPRYGCSEGRNLTSQEQYTLLLKEMEGMEDRRARFVSACVLMLSADRIYIVQETVEGAIAQKAMGLHGFGYDPIFLVEDTGLTASQLSPEEKDRCSHRGRAMRRIDALLEKEIAR